MWIDLLAYASSVWNSTRARVDRPMPGALMTTMPERSSSGSLGWSASPPRVRSSPRASDRAASLQPGKYSEPLRISPDASSQFSTKVACTEETASPSMRHTVSRQRGAFRSWLLGMLEHAEVVGPPALRDDVVAWLRALAG